MFLISVSGSADDLANLTGDAALLDSRATIASDDQWTVVGYAEQDAITTIENMNLGVNVIDDEAAVDADFEAALSDIQPDR
jgi:hypothetical protein